jgi:hypothetical protein
MLKLFRRNFFLFLKPTPLFQARAFPSIGSFTKIGKKKQEKIEKEKSKSQANLGTEIDLSPIEEKMQKEIDNYKVGE